ncbi:MAG: membrane protein insertase YidC [Chloroflexi bacterium]|nr:membrane protein insertase YidC [Chloroflexota bacterium]
MWDILSLLWNEIILNPMQNGLVLLYAFTGRNFGITIIIFTIIVRLITLPLTLKQTRSTKRMSELQPKLQALQKRYAKDRARLSQETMRLYKEAGVNPLGCLGPMVIQFPVWIGLYISIVSLLPTSPERLASLSQHLYSWLPIAHEVVPLNSRFLWFDLAVPDPTPIMAVMVGISMWVLQKMSTPSMGDPRQQSTNRMMLWMMPFMFAFFTISLPSGLPLYWMISNIIGIVIQGYVTGYSELLIFKKKQPVPVPVAALDAAGQDDAQTPAIEESAHEEQAGTSGDQRQDGRRSSRSRAQRARRRSRGSHNRGP